jgi:glutamine amidotransferase
MRVALLDYGIGNMHSLAKALEKTGNRVRIETTVRDALTADALVLPGVGNFGAAVGRLDVDLESLRDALEQGLPCLGVCLGMQLLFERSEEASGKGIGLFPGEVHRLKADRVPHMGWNSVTESDDPLFRNTQPLVAYYANSYVCAPADAQRVIAWTDYGGVRFPAAIRKGQTWGVQFHPEKSGAPGLQLIRNFLAGIAA